MNAWFIIQRWINKLRCVYLFCFTYSVSISYLGDGGNGTSVNITQTALLSVLQNLHFTAFKRNQSLQPRNTVSRFRISPQINWLFELELPRRAIVVELVAWKILTGGNLQLHFWFVAAWKNSYRILCLSLTILFTVTQPNGNINTLFSTRLSARAILGETAHWWSMQTTSER